MRTLRYCLLSILWPVMNSYAQNIRPFRIGETIPDIEIANVYNYPASKIHISDLKSDIIILDFWSIFCGSCIESFPKLQELKKTFGDRLSIFMINSFESETNKRVQAFIDKRKTKTGYTFALPYALQDTTLASLFPHQFIPHCIWLDSTRKIIAITEKDEVSTGNITAVLAGKIPVLHTKNDELVFDAEKPLLVDGNGGNCGDFMYRSMLTSYKQDLGTALGKDVAPGGKVKRFYAINYPLFALFQMAYPTVFKYNSKRTVIDLSDKRAFEQTNDSENKYCYELITSPVPYKDILEFMQNDLFRNFHAIAKLENRKADCYILKANASAEKNITKGGTPESSVAKDNLNKFLRNRSMTAFKILLESILTKPLVDETGILQNIDIDIPGDFYSYDNARLKSFLEQKGFNLTTEKRTLEFTVITDKK